MQPTTKPVTAEGNAPRKISSLVGIDWGSSPSLVAAHSYIADLERYIEKIRAQLDGLLAVAKQADDTLRVGASWTDKDFVIEAFEDTRKGLQIAIADVEGNVQ